MFFLNNLPAAKRLRLQDLTSGDMTRFIKNKLGHLDDDVCSVLVDTVATKACGIFL